MILLYFKLSIHIPPPVPCKVSHTVCHMSCVTCHISNVAFIILILIIIIIVIFIIIISIIMIIIFIIIIIVIVKLVSGGSVINGAYPISLFIRADNCQGSYHNLH